MYGRLPEVRLAGPCHGSFTPVRISHSCPPCVIPIMGAGTGRKYPPAGVMARQPTTGCFWDGRDRWAPYLAVIYADAVCTGGLGAPSAVAWPFRATAGNVFRIGYGVFKEQIRADCRGQTGSGCFVRLAGPFQGRQSTTCVGGTSARWTGTSGLVGTSFPSRCRRHVCLGRS